MIIIYIFISLIGLFLLIHICLFIIFKINYVPVLMYHRVTDSHKENSKRYIDHKGATLDLDSMKVSVENFEKQMKYLANKKKKTNILSNGLSKKNIYITFDDGYKDNLNAAHILEKNSMVATFFVTIGLIKNNEFMPIDQNDQTEENKLLTVKDLTYLSNKGFEIASHTITHPWLDLLTAKELNNEIVDSKTMIEEIVGTKVKSFAYPGGRYNNETLEIVEQNYSFAVATARGSDLSLFNKNKYLIEREAISATDSMLMFKLKVFGVHRFIRKLKWLKKIRGFLKWLLKK